MIQVKATPPLAPLPPNSVRNNKKPIMADASQIIRRSRELILKRTNVYPFFTQSYTKCENTPATPSLEESSTQAPSTEATNSISKQSATACCTTTRSSGIKNTPPTSTSKKLSSILESTIIKKSQPTKPLRIDQYKLNELKKSIWSRRQRLSRHSEALCSLQSGFSKKVERSSITAKEVPSVFVKAASPKMKPKLKTKLNMAITVKAPPNYCLRPITAYARNYQRYLRYEIDSVAKISKTTEAPATTKVISYYSNLTFIGSRQRRSYESQ